MQLPTTQIQALRCPSFKSAQLDALPTDNLADLENRGFPVSVQQLLDLVHVRAGDDEHHADAAVERAAHLLRSDVAAIHDEAEDGREGPARDVDDATCILGEDARDVLCEAAACNVREAFDSAGADGGEEGLDINACGGEELLPKSGLVVPGRGRGECEP